MIDLSRLGAAARPYTCVPSYRNDIMQLKHFTVCAASLAAGAAQAGAFVQVDSLKQLPLAVQQQLGVGKQIDAIADRGERFNGGCLISDNTPQRRFLLGAVAPDVVVVAIEIGGFAHHSSTIEYRRQGAEWIKFDRKDALQFPKTLQELLQDGVNNALAKLN